jgi:hypothetical protein
MKWIDIDKENLGAPLFVTPNYDDGSNRSCFDYCSGIPEIDDILAEEGKLFSERNVEMGILVYEDILMFLLVRGSQAKGHFSISRDKVVKVNAKHGKMLNIRKDPRVGSVLIASRLFGILGAIFGIVANVIIKGMRKRKPVLGSLFEIILDSIRNGENEKIIIACTDLNKERIGLVCNNIMKPVVK